MPINLPVQSLQQLPSSGVRQTDLDAELAAGRTLEASVREVTPDPQRPNLFRIKIEVQRQLMELLTSKPLNTGSRISLSQDAGGKLQLTLLNQPRPDTPAQLKTASQPPVLQLRIPPQGQNSANLAQLLPPGETQAARVIQSTAAPQPAPQPAPQSTVPGNNHSSQQAATQPSTPSITPPGTSAGRAPVTTPAAADAGTRREQSASGTPAGNAPGRPQPAAQERPPTPSSNAGTQTTNLRGSPSATQPPASAVRISLSVNGQQVELLSPRPLQPGLEVQLTRTADNQIQLRLAPPRNDKGAQLKLQEGLQQILRDNLPQQLPAGDALNQIRQISGASRQGGDALAQVVKSMLSLFSVPAKGDTSTTQQVVQNHLQSSGLISQPKANNLQRELPPLQQQLGKLNQLADQLPPQAREQMLTLIKGLQARSASHQANSLQNWQEMPDGSIERQYRLDLPIRLDRDRLEDSEIRIQQHRRPDKEGRFVSLWSIQLHFDPEELGPVDAHVSLQQEWQLSARFWAEREETTRLIREQLDGFQQQLGASGFEVETLQVQRGRPPRDSRSPLNHSLVDLHT